MMVINKPFGGSLEERGKSQFYLSGKIESDCFWQQRQLYMSTPEIERYFKAFPALGHSVDEEADYKVEILETDSPPNKNPPPRLKTHPDVIKSPVNHRKKYYKSDSPSRTPPLKYSNPNSPVNNRKHFTREKTITDDKPQRNNNQLHYVQMRKSSEDRYPKSVYKSKPRQHNYKTFNTTQKPKRYSYDDSKRAIKQHDPKPWKNLEINPTPNVKPKRRTPTVLSTQPKPLQTVRETTAVPSLLQISSEELSAALKEPADYELPSNVEDLWRDDKNWTDQVTDSCSVDKEHDNFSLLERELSNLTIDEVDLTKGSRLLPLVENNSFSACLRQCAESPDTPNIDTWFKPQTCPHCHVSYEVVLDIESGQTAECSFKSDLIRPHDSILNFDWTKHEPPPWMADNLVTVKHTAEIEACRSGCDCDFCRHLLWKNCCSVCLTPS